MQRQHRSNVLSLVPPVRHSPAKMMPTPKITPLRRRLSRATLTEQLYPISEATTERTCQEETQERFIRRDSENEGQRKDNSRDEGDEEYALKCQRNPFLKKKMMMELSSLDKSVCERCHTMPDEEDENMEPLLETQHIIDADNLITYKQIKRSQSQSFLARKEEVSDMMRRMGKSIRALNK